MLGFLRSTVEENSSVDTNDMLPLKRALTSVGHYQPTEGVGLHEYPDEPLFRGIRSFQKQEGLKVDGVMKPGGPTENRLVQKVSDQPKPQNRPNNASSGSDWGDLEQFRPNGTGRSPSRPSRRSWAEAWDSFFRAFERPDETRIPPTHGIKSGRFGDG